MYHFSRMLHVGQLNVLFACEVVDPNHVPAGPMYGAVSFLIGGLCLLFLGVHITSNKRLVPPVAVIAALMVTHPNLWMNPGGGCGEALIGPAMLWGLAIVGVFVTGMCISLSKS